MAHQAYRARTDGENIPSANYPRPPGYPGLEIGLEVKLRRSRNEGWKRYEIVAADRFVPINKYSTTSPANTNFLVATGGSKIDLGTLDDLFETNWDEKGTKQIQSTIIGICSDQQLGLILRQPGTNKVGTVKNKIDDDMVITPEMSPICQPNIWVWSAGKNHQPKLELTNGTGYTPLYYIIILYGDIYEVKEIPDSPKYAYPIDLTHVQVG